MLGPEHVPSLTSEALMCLGPECPSGADDDYALFPLDAHVALGTITPFIVSNYDLESACPSSFTGTYMGYGAENFWSGWASGTEELLRSAALPFERQGDIFAAEINALSYVDYVVPGYANFLPLLNTTKHTMQAGDSGGPLLNGDRLCGVASRPFPEFDPECEFDESKLLKIPPEPPVQCQFDIEQQYADVSRAAVRDWIWERIAIDPMGPRVLTNIRGFCEQGSVDHRDVDHDGDLVPNSCDPCVNLAEQGYNVDRMPDPDLDGVPTRCDSCPNVFNPPVLGGAPPGGAPLLITQEAMDVDADGRGDACDWDDLTPDNVQTSAINTNMEAEIAAFFPHLDVHPSPITNEADAELYSQAFLTGRSEEAPTPELAVGKGLIPTSFAAQFGAGGGGTVPPAGDVAGSCLNEPGGKLPGGIPVPCWVEVMNRIWHEPNVPAAPQELGAPQLPNFVHPASGLAGSVATRWCPCGGLDNIQDSWTQRLTCRSPQVGCIPTDDEFDKGAQGPWKHVYQVQFPEAYDSSSPPADWFSAPFPSDLTYTFGNEDVPNTGTNVF